MRKSKIKFIRGFQLILLTLLSAHAGAEDFADISAEGGVVYFVIDPAIAYSTADLRVSAPDGSVSTILVDNPEVPSYPFEGGALADGSYNYELVLYPRRAADSRKAPIQEEDEEDNNEDIDENGRSPQAAALMNRSYDASTEAPMQSGSFYIQEGALAAPDAEEE